ncbi:MAG: folate-binding protein YgfZ [Boseongicola sp. SB0673_bin_14]|nr:folate-binding protein YgfZ [Boseongicola sp. SB0667_bin_21]MYI68973.1 folate-binding protein YgfZ [Boseongicola sp. SB0673_bin_14]
MSERKVFRVSGADREDYLQNLVTNDVARLKDGLVWTALLTPQGKYLADFFLVSDGDTILLDVAEGFANGLMQRLQMYRLRADVTIEETDIGVARGLGDAPAGAYPDPRDPGLGWRAYDGRGGETADWDAIRVAAGVPESGIELLPNDTYPLEACFERLNGVDFKKGCYVGQEVTARMKHKANLRKGLRRVQVTGEAPVGTKILNGKGQVVGALHSQSGGLGLAYLRLDRVDDGMRAGDAAVRLREDG